MSTSAVPAIVHVVDTLETGGLERVVTDLALEQHAHGHRVTVFSLNATEGFRAVLEAGGVPVLIGDKRGTFDRRLLRALRAACAQADIVHTHNFVPNYYAALAMLGLGRRPRLVNTCHNMGTRLANRRLRWLYRASLARTARVALVGRQVHEHLVGRGIVAASKAVTVHNGIPVERFADDGSRRAAARAALGLTEDARVVGCVGRLVGLKNHRLLLSRLPSLLQRHPSLTAVLIGDGPLRGELQAFAQELGIADRVRFAGARPDVADLLPAFDVFALPSLTEGLSIALLEACATGLAIVASDVGGNPEIVADGRTGLLFDPADGARLEAHLDALLGDAGLRERLGRAAREAVVRDASIQAMRERYARVYAQALGVPAQA